MKQYDPRPKRHITHCLLDWCEASYPAILTAVLWTYIIYILCCELQYEMSCILP